MSSVTNNIVTTGLTGKDGNLVFRMRGKKTTAYVPSLRKGPLCEKQKKSQIDFRITLMRDQHALSIDTERAQFEELAKKEGKAVRTVPPCLISSNRFINSFPESFESKSALPKIEG